MARILGVGIATVDVINLVEHFPLENEEIRATSQQLRRGGNVTNSLTVLAQAGHYCSWLGSLADDSYASLIQADLIKNNINIKNVQLVKHSKSPVSYITLNQANGSRTIVHYRNLPEFNFKQLGEFDFTKYDWIHFEGRAIESTTVMLEKILALNPRPRLSLEIEKPRENIESICAMVDVVMCSQQYMVSQGYEAAGEFLKQFHQRYPHLILSCTLGEKGAELIDVNGKLISQSAFPQTVIDTIGAGDVFNATLINSLMNKLSLVECLRQACQVAAKKCGQIGFDQLLR